jgi:ParB/RepB/Spo0J family partition protein
MKVVKEELKNVYEGVQELDLKVIQEPEIKIRSRIDEEGLKDLMESIKLVGLLQPVLVSKNGSRFEIVVGHRRFLACKKLGLKKIKAIVVLDRMAKLEVMKLHENLAREDVNVVDEAEYLARVMEKEKITQNALAKLIGKSEGYVSQRMGVLNYPPELRGALEKGEIPFSVARELARVDDVLIMSGFLEHARRSGANCNVVNDWVADFVFSKKLAEGGEVGEMWQGKGGEVQELHLPCCVCNLVKPVSQEVMLRVCLDCRKELGV